MNGYGNYGMIPRQEIYHVNGENGARAFQIPPNSSAILLDDSAPLIWVVQTDMNGYKTTVSPYKIEPYELPKPIDPNEILNRLARLEEMLNESNIANAKRENSKSESN